MCVEPKAMCVRRRPIAGAHRSAELAAFGLTCAQRGNSSAIKIGAIGDSITAGDLSGFPL